LIYIVASESISTIDNNNINVIDSNGDIETKTDLIQDNVQYQRIVSIGDIHGAFEGLLDILYSANITKEHWKCDWKPQNKKLLLIQMGDLVDRGGGALESWECLQKLQRTALENNAEVVRLLGSKLHCIHICITISIITIINIYLSICISLLDHELYWLGGIFTMINKVHDRPPVLQKMIQYMKDDVLSGDVVGSYYYNHRNVLPFLFTHGGISPEYLYSIGNDVFAKTKVELDALESQESQELVNKQELFNRVLGTHIQDVLKNSLKTEKCMAKGGYCEFTQVEYAAGKERGGGPIGGPYWNGMCVFLFVC